MPFQTYNNLLKTRPKLTNALTTGFLFGTGDILAQLCFPSIPRKPDLTNETAMTSIFDRFDHARTLRAVVYGSCIFSFIGDKWYRILSKVKFPGPSLQNAKINQVRNTIAKTAVDQLCWAPIGIPLYYSVMSQLEGKTLHDTKLKLEENWWPTLKANWSVWPLFQMFNLGLVPVQYQLLAVNVISIAWNTYLSMRNSHQLAGVLEYEKTEEVYDTEKI